MLIPQTTARCFEVIRNMVKADGRRKSRKLESKPGKSYNNKPTTSKTSSEKRSGAGGTAKDSSKAKHAQHQTIKPILISMDSGNDFHVFAAAVRNRLKEKKDKLKKRSTINPTMSYPLHNH